MIKLGTISKNDLSFLSHAKPVNVTYHAFVREMSRMENKFRLERNNGF